MTPRESGPRRDGPTDPLLVLRGLACLAVASSHFQPAIFSASLTPDWLAPALTGLGHQAVWMFFLLSSFLLTTAFLDGRFQLDRPGLLDFWRSRCWRLLPLLYTVQLSAMFLAALGLYPNIAAFSWLREVSLLTCGPWIPYSDRTCAVAGLNSPLWSVILELHFIAGLPFLTRALVRSRKPHLWFLAGWATYVLALALTQEPVWPRRYEMHLYNMGFFAMGQLLAWNKRLRPQGRKERVLPLGIATMAGLVCSQYLGFSVVDRSLWWSPFFLSPLFYLLLDSVDTRHQGRLPRTYAEVLAVRSPGRALEALGAMSYSIYLCHKPVGFLIIDALGLRGFSQNAVVSGLVLLAVMGAVVTVSSLLYLGVENRFRRQGAIAVHARTEDSPPALGK